MTLPLGEKLKVRSLVYVAGEQIPFFWPMRGFIHHNPLHGFEHLPFEQGVAEGGKLFHARGFLPRADYRRALLEGRVDAGALRARIAAFAAGRPALPGIDWTRWLYALATEVEVPLTQDGAPDAADLDAVRAQRAIPEQTHCANKTLEEALLAGRPIYEAVDALYGTGIGDELDELVIKSCLDFFDEGQSAWGMPERELGFFRAWREIARRNVRFMLRGLHIRQVLAVAETPEALIVHIMRGMGVAEADWQAYFTRELARLHGWAGFIRWRQNARQYYWTKHYPGDLVDYLAVRLALGSALLQERGRGGRIPVSAPALAEAIAARPDEMSLRLARHGGALSPALMQATDDVLARRDQTRIATLYARHQRIERTARCQKLATALTALAEHVDAPHALAALDADAYAALVDGIAAFERGESMVWLHAAESSAIGRLLAEVQPGIEIERAKRPFAQALFCIDTRSERIRRHLERVGDYQTFGIAGFFGVPVSHMPLGKGSETHLCPVLLTPKNLVPELSLAGALDEAALTTLGNALHELKESVFSPFVTVEAVGMLFGLDMVGKTVAPSSYLAWRRRLNAREVSTRLLIDKLSREQADSIVRALQRAVIVKAVRQEFGLDAERLTDDAIRELREAALGHAGEPVRFAALAKASPARVAQFVVALREQHGIAPDVADAHLEHLARIGFSLDQQVGYVTQALRSIGLTSNFSRFVLLAGHGSNSENNPYESALDCGACGGNHGLTSARVLAQMANRPGVRRRLREKGIDIPGDTCFVPALHDTTTDEIHLADIDLLPSSHLLYIDRLREGLVAAARLCAAERVATLVETPVPLMPQTAARLARRNALDWSQVRPEWGLSGNVWFLIGRRDATSAMSFDGRAFLHSYDYRIDPKRRLLENILTGPLVVGQWINMEHYFSTVDNERFGSGSKVYHNVAGRFGVMSGNLSDLRTGLPAQTVLKDGAPYHDPVRLITMIEAPFEHARLAVEAVVAVKRLVHNGWIRLLVLDPLTEQVHLYEDGTWQLRPWPATRTAEKEIAA